MWLWRVKREQPIKLPKSGKSYLSREFSRIFFPQWIQSLRYYHVKTCRLDVLICTFANYRVSKFDVCRLTSSDVQVPKFKAQSHLRNQWSWCLGQVNILLGCCYWLLSARSSSVTLRNGYVLTRGWQLFRMIWIQDLQRVGAHTDSGAPSPSIPKRPNCTMSMLIWTNEVSIIRRRYRWTHKGTVGHSNWSWQGQGFSRMRRLLWIIQDG